MRAWASRSARPTVRSYNSATSARREGTAAIRTRIPAGPAPLGNRPGPLVGVRNGTAPLAAPALAPKPTMEQQHARVLDGLNRARDRVNLDAWARWAKGWLFFPAGAGTTDRADSPYVRHSLGQCPTVQ
jgi:hypothetical protein